MHEMQTIVTDDRGVCSSVSLSHGSTRLHCAKLAEQIKMLFGGEHFCGYMEHCVRWGPDPTTYYISQERLKLEI